MKTCFKCYRSKPLSDFYAHKNMIDGHLNKCKDCARLECKSRYSLKRQNTEWLRKERERCRIKQAKYRAMGLEKRTANQSAKAWAERNKFKRNAQEKANNAARAGKIKRPTICERCGISPKRLEMHHEDYSKPLDVKFLCTKCHGLTRRIDH